jgi:DNA 3'-phosphatase
LKVNKVTVEKGDQYRKPASGMWDFMVKNMNGQIAVEKDRSFYVGGAAGRPKEEARRADHDDYDIKFATNIGVKFILDEQFFDMSSKLPGPKMLFSRRQRPSESDEGEASRNTS